MLVCCCLCAFSGGGGIFVLYGGVRERFFEWLLCDLFGFVGYSLNLYFIIVKISLLISSKCISIAVRVLNVWLLIVRLFSHYAH